MTMDKIQTNADQLRKLFPLPCKLHWIGEFRVKDEFENEVNGLHICNLEQELPEAFMKDRVFVGFSELEELISEGKATPHLAAAWRLFISAAVPNASHRA